MYHKKKSFDLEDSVNEFLYYYNNKKHSTTNMNPFNVMKNMDNKEVIEKVIMMTEKSRNRIKQTVEKKRSSKNINSYSNSKEQ